MEHRSHRDEEARELHLPGCTEPVQRRSATRTSRSSRSRKRGIADDDTLVPAQAIEQGCKYSQFQLLNDNTPYHDDHVHDHKTSRLHQPQTVGGCFLVFFVIGVDLSVRHFAVVDWKKRNCRGDLDDGAKHSENKARVPTRRPRATWSCEAGDGGRMME